MQREGVAAFVALTEPFRDQVDRVMAYHKTDRAIPVVVVPHPIQNVNGDELRSRAESIADQAEAILRGEWDK